MLTPDDIGWIKAHIKEDTAALRLKHRGDSHSAHLINQIECRIKASSKLHETLNRCEAFEFPTALAQEQSTSDALAEFHASLVDANCTCADLTAGLGIDVLHMAAKSKRVVAVEIDESIAGVLHDNASAMNLQNIEVISGDCRNILPKLGKFDFIFIDPARRDADGKRVYALSDCTPDVLQMMPEIALHTPKLIIKMSPMLDITDVARRLHPFCNRIIALGDRRECKELIAICQFDRPTDSPDIDAVTIIADKRQHTFGFKRENEEQTQPEYCKPIPGKYLIDPYPSVMKTAPWCTLCKKLQAGMIADNTHLYIADKPHTNIGESYIIEEVLPFASSQIKRFAKKYPTVSVATRNFPLRADALQKKLKVHDADTPRLYGVTDNDGQRLLIVSTRC